MLIDSTWSWRQLTPATPPDARYLHDMVWDGSRVLMYGGLAGGAPSDETWELVGDEWNLLSPADSPGPLATHKMMWDGSRVILMGGTDDTFDDDGPFYSQKTWKYQAANWSEIVTANFPPNSNASVHDGGIPWWASPLCWDGSRGLINWFTNLGGLFLWEFSADDWSDVTPADQPNPRTKTAMCWAGDRLVIGGGSDTADRTFNDTSEYETDWAETVTNQDPVTDSNHWLHRKEMRFVWTGEEVFMFGGGTATVGSIGQPCTDESWTYDKATGLWTQVFPAGGPPTARKAFAMVWDGHRVIVHGGQDASEHPLDDTWVLEPPTIYSISHAFGLRP